MIVVLNNTENKAGQALVEYFGSDRVSGIRQGYRSDLKNVLPNLIVGGSAGNAREEGVIALDASLATPEQAENLHIAEIVARGEHLEVFLRWYVLLHTMLPNRSIGRLVEQHNSVVPERYHVTAKINERGCVELHHNEPLLRGYIDGDPCNIGLTTWVDVIDPLYCYNGEDIPLWSIMDAYERLSPDWGGHREYDTYLHDYTARKLANWRDDYWYKGGLTLQNYQDLFNVYWRDSVQRRLTVKYGRKVKPLTYRR